MAYAARATSILDLPIFVLQMPTTSRHVNVGDARTKCAAAQARLELVPTSPLVRTASILFAPLSVPISVPRSVPISVPLSVSFSAHLATPSATLPINLANTVSAPVSAADVEVSISACASGAVQVDTISVEQYLWSVCWFLMGFLFLCAT